MPCNRLCYSLMGLLLASLVGEGSAYQLLVIIVVHLVYAC